MSESENESGDEFEEKMDENDKDPDQEPESDEDLEGLEKALQGKELKFIYNSLMLQNPASISIIL